MNGAHILSKMYSKLDIKCDFFIIIIIIIIIILLCNKPSICIYHFSAKKLSNTKNRHDPLDQQL